MRTAGRNRSNVSRKCLKACDRCRYMKLKCSGSQPCTRCARKRQECHFAVEETRVSVSESYLRELERRCGTINIENQANSSIQDVDKSNPQALLDCTSGSDFVAKSPPTQRTQNTLPTVNARPNQVLSQGCSQEAARVPAHVEETFGFRQNPLVDTDYTFAKSPDGRYYYMGPSSSWSFCRRVLALIGKHMPEANCPPDPWNQDGAVYRMQWTPLSPDEAPEVTNLPPLDYALFLFNSVKFHFGPLFYLIDEPSYIRNLYDLYEDAASKASTSRLWYAQYLLVLAFGKAFIGAISCPGSPPGHQYAYRAMRLLPDLSGLSDDALLATQVLALAAVYFQAVDMRVAAFYHIGQAMRTCVIEGWHRHMPEDVVGTERSRRCNDTFWVVYMLEREFSALMGSPSSIRDEDITAGWPSHTSDSLDSWNMTLLVRLSRLIADILTTVYGVQQAIDGSLVRNTQNILRVVAELSQDLNDLLNKHFQGSVNKASRMAIRLVLSYHRCIVLTTRPLVMCALHMHMKRSGANGSSAVPLSAPVASLIQSGADSARNILRILRLLGDEDLIDPFLPFQLEDAFSSAFVLYLLRAVAPWFLPDDTWGDDVECVLNRMIAKGNLVAPVRKVELGQLADVLAPLTPGAVHFASPQTTWEVRSPNPSIAPDEDDVPSWDLFMNNVGLDPHQILDLAAQLNMEPITDSAGI